MKKRILIVAAALLLCGCNAAPEDTSLLSGNITLTEGTSSDFTPSDTTSETAVSETTTFVTTSETAENVTEPAEISEEQARLEALIDERAGGENAGEVCLPVFGDFDGDGKGELIAIYGETDEKWGDTEGEVWFASGNEAYRLFGRYRYLAPKIVTSMGRTFIKAEACSVSDSCSLYAELKNSRAEQMQLSVMQGLYPDGEYGDFTYAHSTYDMSAIYDDNGTPSFTGHTWKTYRAYLDGDNICDYGGRKIDEDELLQYEGASDVIQYIEEQGGTKIEPVKYSNGFIAVNYTVPYSNEDESFYFRLLKYRDGAVYDVTGLYGDIDEDRGIYQAMESYGGFDRLSELIYDTVSGGEDDRICGRAYGDFDGDGEGELFAVYGSGNHGRLYFANDNGVSMIGEEGYWTSPEIVTVEGVSLIYTERLYDTNSVSCYFQVKDGVPYRVETYGLSELRPAAEEGDFAAYHTTYDIYNDKVGGSLKPYWFYAVNNSGEIRFMEYHAVLRYTEDIDGFITDAAEEFGCDIKPYIDETAEWGEIDSLIKRSGIGIININYTVDGKRRYRSLKLRDGEVYDITPENNAGHYVAMVTANYILDYKMM
ncbi:MAG: hypothetical protein ACI4JF_01965 [Oscillospiraceae bacterium]